MQAQSNVLPRRAVIERARYRSPLVGEFFRLWMSTWATIELLAIQKTDNTWGFTVTTLTPEQRAQYWRRNRNLMIKLMMIWFLVSFVFGILLVDQLNMLRIGGYKLGFWFAQQGSIFVFIGLIFYYVSAMRRLDKEFGLDTE
jgi:putative solute:sodium symporter small subunit